MPEGFQGIAELTDKVAADAAIEKLFHATNGGRCGQLGVNLEVTKFILQQGKLIVLWQLGDQIEDEGCFAGTWACMSVEIKPNLTMVDATCPGIQ